MEDLPWVQIILIYTVLLVSLVVHEAAHAWVAKLGGDMTAYMGGQVTLNPVPHIQRSPFGTVVLPLLMLFSSSGTMAAGFASAPYDAYWAQKHPKRAALMALAGPTSNFVLVVLASAVLVGLAWSDMINPILMGRVMDIRYEHDGVGYAIARIAYTFVFLNTLLGLLNLIPWPPLDGASVLEGFFQKQLGAFYAYIKMQPFLMIAGILAVFMLLQRIFWPVLSQVEDLIRYLT